MEWLLCIFGLGSVSRKWQKGRAIIPIYNYAIALSLCVLGVIVYLEEKLLYSGFSIFATCLSFVVFYLVLLRICITLTYSTYYQREHLELLEEIGKFAHGFQDLFPYTTFTYSHAPVLLIIALYSAAVPFIISFKDQFISTSFTVSCYVTTVISLLYTNHFHSLLNTCKDAFEGLNQYVEINTQPHKSTLDKISIALSSRKIDLDVGLNELMTKHREIRSLTIKVIKQSTLSIGLSFLSTAFAFNLLLTTLLMLFISRIQTRVSQWSAIYTFGLEAILHCLEMYLNVRKAEQVTRSANRIAIVLHKLRNLHPNFGGDLFKEYSLQLLNEKLEITLGGVFTMDFSFLFDMAVAFSTMLIISLQCDEDFLVTNPKTVLILAKLNHT